MSENHADFALGFADETWWSRLRQPALHSWTAGPPLRLHELARPQDDMDPKALACYGLLLRHSTLAERVWLCFVSGRPVSALTIQFLAWSCQQLEALQMRALFLIWDNASWHKSQRVRQWIREHNQLVKRTQQGVRLIVCPLPIKSPWLNPIEPKWVHAKRRIVEAERVLTAPELVTRVSDALGCPMEPFLSLAQ